MLTLIAISYIALSLAVNAFLVCLLFLQRKRMRALERKAQQWEGLAREAHSCALALAKAEDARKAAESRVE